MFTGAWCGMAPLLLRKKLSGFEGKEQASKSSKASKNHKQINDTTVSKSCGVAGNFTKLTGIRNKILTLRDLLDLSPCVGSASVNEILIWTLKDLHGLYPSIKPSILMSEMEGASMNQVLHCFCNVLKSLGDSWTDHGEWMVNGKYDASIVLDQDDLEELAQAMLEDVNKLASERMFDMMDEDEQMNDYSPSENAFGKALSESYSDSKTSLSSSPATPNSVIPVMSNMLSKSTKLSYSPPLLLQLRVQAVEKLNPIDVKRLSFHMLSHTASQDPNYLVQKSETIEERHPTVKAKNESEAKATGINDFNQDFEMEEDTVDILMTTLDESASNAGKNWTCKAYLESGPAPNTPAKGDIDVVPPPASLHKLRSNVSAEKNHPSLPADNTLSPDAVSSQVSAPPLPAQPMFSPNEALSVQKHLTPSETFLSSPNISLNLKAGPSTPAQPSLSSIAAASIAGTPPPPPPPVTLVSMAFFPAPPPPPPTSLVISRFTTPLPPPPPPSMASGNLILPPPPPPPPKASGKMAPPPPFGTSNRGAPPPPPPPSTPTPMLPAMGGAPPPPLGLGGAKNLCLKKAATRLKRSSQMGNLYRLLKGKVEGCNLDAKSSRKGKVGSSTGGKQGMADALAEMTKRSAYFQQIEEDVKNHEKSIRELKASINSFQSTDMAELHNFHKHVESILEKLTDETQVLARFEDFPTKKLEALRMAGALYSKLDTIVTTLKNWRIESPIGQVINKVENYFNKIKQELDALERTKDEESKKFQNHKINFDFSILLRIKELMVDVSSSCMEQALKERRDAKAVENAEKGPKTESLKKGSAKILWKAFQFAYRVYTFAGGHDDHADQLTRELATEIQTDPNH